MSKKNKQRDGHSRSTSHGVITEENSSPIYHWTNGVPFEDHAKAQLRNIAKLPFIHRHVAVMPDVHAGIGATVGSVIATKNAIIPAAVGCDLGCGMIACMTDLTANDLPSSLSSLRLEIESNVPHGRSDNGGTHDVGSWRGKSPILVESAWLGLEAGYKRIMEDKVRAGKISPMNQLGTLGTGNHFIEVCLDEDDRVWIMLHSGSRGIGNAIGSHYIELAKQDMKKWFVNLPDMNLAYLPEGTDHFHKYVMAVEWAQEYARVNREVMFSLVVKAMEKNLRRKIDASVLAVSCHHNYISRENHFGENVIVTRKGAVSARLGQLGIIPGSMGARSYIVRGKGCADSFTSCSHGAGRKMSRTEAEKTFTLQDHIAATSGVECRKDKGVIDETPMAYKDIDAVMDAQKELVDIVHTLRQIVCIKG